MKTRRAKRPMKTRSPSDDGLRDWYEVAFAQLVSSPEVRRAAQLEMSRLAVGGEVAPQAADLEAARVYLRRCITNMPVPEVESITANEAGALWARGALGAARYRLEGGGRRKRRRRFKSLRATSTTGRDDSDDD